MIVWQNESFTLAFYVFFSITSDKIKATCSLWYFDLCSILTSVFSQQFWLHARSGNSPYFYVCGKMNVLPSHFKYFFCYYGSNQRQLHVLWEILFHCHSGYVFSNILTHAAFWLACFFQQFRLHARQSSKPFSRLCGKMKFLQSFFHDFFLLAWLKSYSKSSWDRILACVTIWRSYARILFFFLLMQMKSKPSACSL